MIEIGGARTVSKLANMLVGGWSYRHGGENLGAEFQEHFRMQGQEIKKKRECSTCLLHVQHYITKQVKAERTESRAAKRIFISCSCNS